MSVHVDYEQLLQLLKNPVIRDGKIVLGDSMCEAHHYRGSRVRKLMLNVNGPVFRMDQVHAVEHGDMNDGEIIDSKRGFVKVFSNPRFSSQVYMYYWMLTIECMQSGTGIIRRYVSGRRIPVRTVRHWELLLGASSATVNRFRGECVKRGFIRSSADAKGNRIWVVNPSYAWRGKSVPRVVHDLFAQGGEVDA